MTLPCVALSAPESEAFSPPAASDADRVEITTVGIDIGSATYHLAFSRVRLERRAQELSTSYEVVHRQVLWSSPVAFTPYRFDDEIDADAVAAATGDSYRLAGIDPSEIDSGAVLLTGTALARHNARPLAERLAGSSGRFVCAAAGHHMEAVLAAHGSGAVERSAGGSPVLAVDIGGGTTKLALAVDGAVRATAALAVGARLVAWDLDGRLTRVEASVVPLAEALGIDLVPGERIPPGSLDRMCSELAGAVIAQLPASTEAAAGPRDPRLLTEPLPPLPPSCRLVVSGGVAEYLDRPGDGSGHGDLGARLAAALRLGLERSGLESRRLRAWHGIRATVIGASQFSTQVSGSTIQVGDESHLPLHGVPVLRPQLDLRSDVDAGHVAGAIRRAAAARPEAVRAGHPVALAVHWHGPPEHRRLRALADGIHAAAADALAGATPVVVTVDRDLAASLGRIMVEEAGMSHSGLLCLDNLDVGELDHLDIGCPSRPANVVPVVVKSLLFDAGVATATPPRAQEDRAHEPR